MNSRHIEARFWTAMLVLGLLRLVQIGACVFGALLVGSLVLDGVVTGWIMDKQRIIGICVAAAVGVAAGAGCVLVEWWNDKTNELAANVDS